MKSTGATSGSWMELNPLKIRKWQIGSPHSPIMHAWLSRESVTSETKSGQVWNNKDYTAFPHYRWVAAYSFHGSLFQGCGRIEELLSTPRLGLKCAEDSMQKNTTKKFVKVDSNTWTPWAWAMCWVPTGVSPLATRHRDSMQSWLP